MDNSTSQNSQIRATFFARFKNIDKVLFGLSILMIIAKVFIGYFPLLHMLLISIMGMSALLTFQFGFSENLIYDSKNNILTILMGLGASLLTIGCLFGLMFWPGNTIMLYAGLLFSLVSLIWIGATLEKKTFGLENQYNKILLCKMLVYGIFALWVIQTPSVERFKTFHSLGNDPIAVQLYEAYQNDRKDQAKREAYYQYVHKAKKK